MVCSGAIFNYMTMADSCVINSRQEPNSVQSLLQCTFERRHLAETLKVKQLGPDQPDGLIYCEELFVKLFAVPQPHLKKFSPAATGIYTSTWVKDVCTFAISGVGPNTPVELWGHYTVKTTSFGWDVKPRSSVVIKNPMALLVKSVTPVSWPNSPHWPSSNMAC